MVSIAIIKSQKGRLSKIKRKIPENMLKVKWLNTKVDQGRRCITNIK